jgi:hypothetical protein
MGLSGSWASNVAVVKGVGIKLKVEFGVGIEEIEIVEMGGIIDDVARMVDGQESSKSVEIAVESALSVVLEFPMLSELKVILIDSAYLAFLWH